MKRMLYITILSLGFAYGQEADRFDCVNFDIEKYIPIESGGPYFSVNIMMTADESYGTAGIKLVTPLEEEGTNQYSESNSPEAYAIYKGQRDDGSIIFNTTIGGTFINGQIIGGTKFEFIQIKNTGTLEIHNRDTDFKSKRECFLVEE